MEKIYLTPEQQTTLDPTGKNYRTMSKFVNTHKAVYDRPSPYIRITPEEMMDRYRKVFSNGLVSSKRHAPYLEYNSEMFEKYGPQGGIFSWETMYNLLTEYYTHAYDKRDIGVVLIRGRDYLIARLRARVEMRGYPQDVPVLIYNTNAALPTGMKKGTYLAETTGAKPWRHMWPTILGQRRMRLKDRLIFQDSILNVRYIESTLSAVRYWLRQEFPEYFDAWLNPRLSMNKRLTRWIEACNVFVESDYISMDQRFSWELVQNMILPIYEILRPDSFLSFAAAVEELFTSPVYCGDFIVTGLHNLFSGEAITNDFETIYTVELVLGIAIELGLINQVELVAIGDDTTVSLPAKLGIPVAREFLETMRTVSGEAGMLIHEEGKSRIASRETRFCRRVYYPAGTRDAEGALIGAYPTVLALNNIVQPERRPTNASNAAIADLQRLDNCWGTPEWTNVVTLVRRFATHNFEFDPTQERPVDWWERVYGERWDPAASITLQTLLNL